jgi:hypothetical protein
MRLWKRFRRRRWKPDHNSWGRVDAERDFERPR